MSKKLVRILLIACSVAGVLLIVHQSVAMGVSATRDYCVVNVDEPEDDPECFFTPAAALDYASGGVLDVGPLTTEADALEALELYDQSILPTSGDVGDADNSTAAASGEVSASSTYVFAVHWDQTNYNGLSLILSSNTTCTAVSPKQVRDFSAYGWDDRPRSGKLYAGCTMHTAYFDAWHSGFNNTFTGTAVSTYGPGNGNISSAIYDK